MSASQTKIMNYELRMLESSKARYSEYILMP